MGTKNTTGSVPKTSAKMPKFVEERILFKKSQKRLLQELTSKHTREIEVVINEILEDEGLIDKLKKADRTTMIPGFQGIILFKRKKIGGQK